MHKSRIIRFPDFSELQIPEANRVIKLSDRKVFKEVLNQNRQVLPTAEAARKGDYVLAEISFQGREPEVMHIELGGRHFPEYEAALQGCRGGERLDANIYGETASIRVLSVGRTVELELTDEKISRLALPGIHSKADFRENYVAMHGAEISSRIFHAIKDRLFQQLLALTEAELDQEELDAYNKHQYDMIEHVTGGADERLLAAYGNGGKSMDECMRLFHQDNRQSFIFTLLGHTLAERDGKLFSPEEKAQALEYYQSIWEKSPAEIEEEGLMDDVLEPLYLQYTINSLKSHFQSVVRFETECP